MDLNPTQFLSTAFIISLIYLMVKSEPQQLQHLQHLFRKIRLQRKHQSEALSPTIFTLAVRN